MNNQIDYIDLHIINIINRTLPNYSITWKTAILSQLRELVFFQIANSIVKNPYTNRFEIIPMSYYEINHLKKLKNFVLNMKLYKNI